MLITAIQKRRLKQNAHKLKPVVIVGQQGLTDNVAAEIERALNDHELIKIRIQHNDRDYKKQVTTTICERHQATLIQTIGHTIVIYRQSPENKR